MIARTWSGRVPTRHADGFHRHLLATGVADTEALAGFLGAEILRRERDGLVEFRLVTFWESRQAIEAFAGAHIDVAVLYPGDEEYELVPDRYVEHHEVVLARPGLAS